jgi:DNA invertase Pin-like site-specific DNA recombinase
VKIAHIYARFSTGTQAKGTSLRRQISNAEAFAAEQGWTIADIIADEGVSAYRGKNLAQGGLGRFLDAVKTGKVAPGSVLIVESLDRLSRNTLTAQMMLLLDIIRAGVEVVTLVDQRHFTRAMVSTNPLELIFTLAIMIRAQDESRTKGGRIAAAWSMKRSRLETHKLTRRCPPWLTLSQDRSR